MNTPSSPATGRVLIWDLPVRIFHWLLVASFAGAYVTGKSDSWRTLHVTLGYTVAALVAFRIAWGFVGTRYARFADFLRPPSAALKYLRSMLAGRPQHHAGHNPAGAMAIVALLVLAALVAATGWATYAELGGERLEEFHEVAANVMLAIVLVHVAGVVAGSIAEHENLVRAMFTGRKRALPSEAIRSPRRWAAVIVIAIVAAVWWAEWDQAPLTPSAHERNAGSDDD